MGGTQITVRLTDGEVHALRCIMATGKTKSEALRIAVRILGDALQCAWDHGDAPEHAMPGALQYTYAPAAVPPGCITREE